MSLTKSDVEKVALLARLRLSESEVAAMTGQLGRILDYVEQLGELDTEDVAPLAHPMEISNVFADDLLGESLDRDKALANAPKRDEECYRVPPVFSDG